MFNFFRKRRALSQEACDVINHELDQLRFEEPAFDEWRASESARLTRHEYDVVEDNEYYIIRRTDHYEFDGIKAQAACDVVAFDKITLEKFIL